MDIKSIVRFNDSEFRTYAQSVGTPNRYNLSMNREDAAELDAIAKALDMDRGRLIRELLHIGAAMFSINPQPFIDESKRCHIMLAQSLTLAARETARWGNVPNEDQPPADYFAEIKEV